MPTVQVVEDEAIIRDLVAEELEEAGFTVVIAVNADHAISILENRLDIHLVFTDIDMPGSMDGLKLAAAVRDRRPHDDELRQVGTLGHPGEEGGRALRRVERVEVLPVHLDAVVDRHHAVARCPLGAVALPPEGMDYQRALEDFEVGILTQALTRVRGNKTAAADLLGLKRTTLAAKMKAHTAQQRFSAGLLCCLPLVVGIGFYILKPDYVRLLWTDPVGIKFFTYAICSEIVGILVIRKLAKIKV